MKKFQFTLNPLLRLRHFKEEKCKIEMGQIVSEVTKRQNLILEIDESIDNAYIEQEAHLKKGLKAHEASFYPHYVEGRQQHITQLKKEIENLLILQKEKLVELSKLRAESKVLEKLNEKELESYKQEYNRHETKVQEEGVQLWMLNQKKLPS